MSEILVISGAGISVDSGIKPFRGVHDAIWEENPIEMASFKKYYNDPAGFLIWYYQRFAVCREAKPNLAHKILSKKNIKVITQNIDNLHIKAGHHTQRLIEIHGNLCYKRKLYANQRNELVLADWENLNKDNLSDELLKRFCIKKNRSIDENSYRPHVLLFDESYSELYEYNKALEWARNCDTHIFIGTSNSVGITASILQLGLLQRKKIIVVDPSPDASFRMGGVELREETATEFCKEYF